MSKFRRGVLLAAVSSAATLAGAFAASAETLADAIALAYETNPTLQAQRASQRALDESVVQARASGYRPQISGAATAGYSHTRVPGGGGGGLLVDTNGDGIPDTPAPGSGRATTIERNTGVASLSASQPIWTGGRVKSAVEASEADVLAGRENLRRVEMTVLQTVITAYVDVRRDMQSLAIRQENVAVLQRALEEAQARFDVGEITRTDVAQAEARLSAAQAALAQAQAQLSISRANYAAAVGQNPTDLAPEPPMAPLLPATVEQAFDSAENNNAQLRAAEYTEQGSRARLAAAKADRLPSLAATGGLSLSGRLDPFEPKAYSRTTTVGARLSVPIFTGGLTSSRIRAAAERNNADRISVETARRAALQQTTQAWSQTLAARAGVTSNDAQVRATRIAAEGTREEQRVGLRTTLDVLNAEQEYRNAQLAYVSAQRDEYVAGAALLAAAGQLDARYFSQVTPYDPAANARKVSRSFGWVPWEPVIEAVDSVGVPRTTEKPLTTTAPVATAPAAR